MFGIRGDTDRSDKAGVAVALHKGTGGVGQPEQGYAVLLVPDLDRSCSTPAGGQALHGQQAAASTHQQVLALKRPQQLKNYVRGFGGGEGWQAVKLRSQAISSAFY